MLTRLAVLLLPLLLLVSGCAATGAANGGYGPKVLPTTTDSGSGAGDTGSFPIIHMSQLPPEARQTIGLIKSGGPFPYKQDGAVFQNREELLPSEPSGYYHEYTVVTPGSPDRGARRIIAGSNGEMYYTDDHYASFKRIVP